MPARPSGVFTGQDRIPDQLECDVVIVGSGAGGAVVAAELAENGLDVVVLEEGGYHPAEEFSAGSSATVRKLYRDGGAQMALGNPPIQFAEGRCVGGSTVINGGMSWRTPEKVLTRWQREDAVEAILPADMEPFFSRVEKFISAQKQDPDSVGRDNELLKEGAEKRGWKVIPNIRNQFHCAGTNNCAFGCPTGAKRSTLVTYIPRALAFGARVYADRRVERVLFKGKRVIGVEGTVLGKTGTGRFSVHARLVVLAAGAMQTPALLLRSGVRSRSGSIGRNLTLHPNVKVVAIFDELVEGWKGVHQAYQVREFEDAGFLMAAVNIPPSVLAMTLPCYGSALDDIMQRYNHIVVAGLLFEDTVTGRVRLARGEPVAFYSLSDQDAARLVHGTGLLCELLFAAGAKRIILPFEGKSDLRSPDDLRRLKDHEIPKSTFEVMTVHIMGSARMGGDPTRHVCDSYGRVYNTEGLIVSDASIFPSPIGVNPMETIMALATRNALRILESEASWRKAA